MNLLTEENIKEFRELGFTKVNHFWSDSELAGIKSALEELVSAGKLNNVATDGDGLTHTLEDRNLQLCPLMPEHKIFDCLPYTDKVRQAVSSLLVRDPGEGVCCYLSQTFWKPARHGLGTGWHQDNAYFKLSDGRRGTAMWTAVHDATVENGTLHVIPGYDGEVLEHVRDGTSDHHISCQHRVDDSKAVAMEVPAGGVVFFNCNTPHCTKENKTDHPRAAVAYHFVNMEVVGERHFSLPEGAVYETPVVVGKGANMEEVIKKQNMLNKLIN